jgi:hypothetical protein
MAPYQQCILLLAMTLFWAGCASQKTQTVDHPPTSILTPISTEGQSELLVVELDAAAVAKDAEAIPVSSGEALKVTGPAGVAGEPGATKESGAQSSLPLFPAGTEKSMQISGFPENTLGPDSPPGLVGESPVVSLERLALPPENLAVAEYPGLAGEAGESLNPLAAPSIPETQPENPAEVEFPHGKPMPSFRANDQRHGTPPPAPSNRPSFPGISKASDTEEEKTREEPRIAWPWRGPEDTPKPITVATDSQSFEDLLAWVNGRNLAKPDDKDGDLDDFSNHGEALAWLLGRAAPGGATGNLSDTRKQAAILDWLSTLRQNTSTSPYTTGSDRDLAGVLDWFRSGGGSADNKLPDQADLTGATRQLARWLRQASGQDNGAEGPGDSLGAGSKAMIKWLAQGRETEVSPDSSVIRRRNLQFPFRPFPGNLNATENVRKNAVVDGTSPFPSLFKNSPLSPPNRPLQLQGKLHQWLHHPGGEGPEDQGVNQNLQDSIKYSAAFSWILQGADSSKEKRSSNQFISNGPSSLRRPDLATQEHLTEALRWFHKGSGQRRHRLHAAAEPDGTGSQTP